MKKQLSVKVLYYGLLLIGYILTCWSGFYNVQWLHFISAGIFCCGAVLLFLKALIRIFKNGEELLLFRMHWSVFVKIVLIVVGIINITNLIIIGIFLISKRNILMMNYDNLVEIMKIFSYVLGGVLLLNSLFSGKKSLREGDYIEQ